MESCSDLDGRLLEEFRSLREELRINKQYVFERPLLIVGAAAAGIAQLKSPAQVSALVLLFIMVLGFNLWFTFNRLKSNARIIAYFQTVLDPGKERQWVGWETALERWRLWSKSDGADAGIQAVIRSECQARERRDTMMFYAPIFYLHLATAAVGLAASAGSTLVASANTRLTDMQYAEFGVAAAAFLCMFTLSLRFLNPGRLKSAVEAAACIWSRILALRQVTPKEAESSHGTGAPTR